MLNLQKSYQDAGIRHSCHDAVAAHEVDLIRIRTGKKFGEQTALLYHLSIAKVNKARTETEAKVNLENVFIIVSLFLVNSF